MAALGLSRCALRLPVRRIFASANTQACAIPRAHHVADAFSTHQARFRLLPASASSVVALRPPAMTRTMSTKKFGQRQSHAANASRRQQLAVLVDQDGKNMGRFSIEEIQDIAGKQGLMAVEVTSGDEERVVRLMSKSELQEKKKRIQEIKTKNKKASHVSIVMMTIAISDHDLEVKAKQIKRLLEKGGRVKVVVSSKTERDGIDREAAKRDQKLTTLANLTSEFAKMKKEPEAPKKARDDDEEVRRGTKEIRTFANFSSIATGE